MKKFRGEVVLSTLVIAMIGCIATGWLEHLGVPLPTPSVVKTEAK